MLPSYFNIAFAGKIWAAMFNSTDEIKLFITDRFVRDTALKTYFVYKAHVITPSMCMMPDNLRRFSLLYVEYARDYVAKYGERSWRG